MEPQIIYATHPAIQIAKSCIVSPLSGSEPKGGNSEPVWRGLPEMRCTFGKTDYSPGKSLWKCDMMPRGNMPHPQVPYSPITIAT